MRARALVVLAAAFTAPLAVASDRSAPQRPVLTLRATPGVTFAPASVLLVAELVGGDAVEELYCPEVVWDFDDGRRSTSQADCEPFGAGSELERRFLVRQLYTAAGQYRPTITLRGADGVVARAATTVLVPAAAGSDGPFAASNR
jgi:hypothetical protein